MVNRHFILFALAFAAALSGVAKTFDVDISAGRPAASNEAYYHGETIEFRAVRGRSVVTNVEYGCIYYQTNGMDSVWWKTDGLTFHPTNDVGAASYRFFLEGRDDLGRDWHANGLLRLLPSPGFTPNEIELPVARLDFANIEVANAPYYDKTETEAKIVELAPAPDFSTNNTELVETIEATAPAPGNYAAVSNAAVHAAITNALQDTALESLSDTTSTLTDSISSLSTNVAANAASLASLSSAVDAKLDKSGGTVTGEFRVGAMFDGNFQVVPESEQQGTYIPPTMRFSDGAGVLGIIWRLEDGYVVMDVTDLSGTAHRIALPSASGTLALTNDVATAATAVSAAVPSIVTNIVQDLSLGGIWDAELEVWWTPRMRNGSLTYEATTNVNLNAEN